MNGNIERFLTSLEASDKVTVDGGNLQAEVDVSKVTGKPDNQVVRLSWSDGECEYADILTEEGIAGGTFEDGGKFICENKDGEKTVIRFYAVERLNEVSCMRAASMFFKELHDSVETLTGIADEHGPRTLADLMFLQNAILKGSYIVYYPDESKVLEIAEALPTGGLWLTFIKPEKHWQGEHI